MLTCSAGAASSFDDGLKAYKAEDFEKAFSLFDQACDAGEAPGCGILGFMYENGQGVKQDYFEAVKLYQKACDGGIAGACSNLGFMYYNGQGTKIDKRTALDYFGKACDMRNQ